MRRPARTRTETRESARTAAIRTREPAVILDLLFEDGQLFFLLLNHSERPAYDVTVRFDRKILGCDGSRDIAALALFAGIPFLAPRKAIRVYIDRAASYFARKQPARITAEVSYADPEGRIVSAAITHDLGIYRDLPCLGQPR